MGDKPFVTVARTVKAHGVAGEVAVEPRFDDDLTWLEGITVWFVPPAGRAVGHEVTRVRRGPKGPLLTFDGVTDADTASALRGRAVLVDHAEVPAAYLEEEPDPLGLRVHDSQRGDIGVVEDVIVTGANDVWVVRGGRLGEVLVPVIDDVVLSVDFDSRTAEVDLLPGLVDGEEIP